MYILGISAFYHDSAAALVKDGEIVAAAQEERFTRKKGDSAFPARAADFCLRTAGISANSLDRVVFYENSLRKFARLLSTYAATAPRGFHSYLSAMDSFLKSKLWTGPLIRSGLKYDGKIHCCDHHMSHAASAFYPSPFQEAAILTMDGVGEWATMSIGAGEGNKITLLKELKFPHSPGMFYSAFTYYTGFKVNSGEYKLMGLAPYGEPKYADLIMDKLIDIREDGSFRMNMKYFNYCSGFTMTSPAFHKLFGGEPRQPETMISQKEMDIAKSVQVVFEHFYVKLARAAAKITGKKNLCLAGGCALNCVGNGKIFRENIFDDMWIQPAAGDAGGALGCALHQWYSELGNPRHANGRDDFQKGSLLGPSPDNDTIQRFLDSNGIKYSYYNDSEMPKKVAELIASQKVVALMKGRMEFGPRALGARSIIADPANPEMQSQMNLKIKFRESFRPFAPSVLEERAADYFKFPRGKRSPYMLLVTEVRDEIKTRVTEDERSLWGIEKLKVKRSTIPAVTHVDCSARIQTVDAKTNPFYHSVISEFEKLTSRPVIINTSFNVRGEPIVCSHEDAYRCFMRTNIDYLVLENFLLDKTGQKPLENDSDWRKEFALD